MAVKASREFQIFAKPVGAICNLDCHYCYYLQKELLYPQTRSFHMPDDLLEDYIVQQIEIAPEPVKRKEGGWTLSRWWIKQSPSYASGGGWLIARSKCNSPWMTTPWRP
jgi:hypothetical protein